MKEAEWLASTDPSAMLEYLRGRAMDIVERKVSARKLRLFAVACCRSCGPARKWSDGYIAVMEEACRIAEDYVDGLGPLPPWRGTFDPKLPNETSFCLHDPDAFNAAVTCVTAEWQDDSSKSLSQEAALLRDIVGNPYRPVVPLPKTVCSSCGSDGEDNCTHEDGTCRCKDCGASAWMEGAKWLTPTVLSIARRIYADRDFGITPMLADALEEAGCDNQDILDHCRGPGPHVRGCWALDLILGKE